VELLFESRLEIRRIDGRVRAVQARPEVLPEPVVLPDSAIDGTGASIYGTVLQDGGRFRMWYQAWPRDWNGRTVDSVAYAESEDGYHWTKPDLGLGVDDGPSSNLTDLALHSPAVFVDPEAEPSHRYRATGYTGPGRPGARADVSTAGYYTAHSADGLHWELDDERPRWLSGDVITSVYHPLRRQAIAAMKFNPWAGGIARRAIWTAEYTHGRWGAPRAALIPDAYDDVCALSRGYASGDYYGMGMLPAGRGMAGFLWHFRHALPRTPGSGRGIFGAVDVGLAFQSGPGEPWLLPHAREDWITHGVHPWASGCVYTATCPVTVGDEQRLYITGTTLSHGWYLDENWRLDARRYEAMKGEGRMAIGVVRWPRDRLFGLRADPEGTVDLHLGDVPSGATLLLNYCAEPGGSVRVEALDREGHSLRDSVALEGEAVEGVAAWRRGAALPAGHEEGLTVRLHLERASVYAYEVRT